MNKNNIPEILIVGLPNSGKSTLINALTSSKTSIIGSTPNTTRDKVTSSIEFEDDKLLLISDLPGYLEDPNAVEIDAQNIFLKYISKAEIVIFLIDINTKNFSGLEKIFKLLNKDKNRKKIITVYNKCENFQISDKDSRLYKFDSEKNFYISAHHKLGLIELKNELYKYSKKQIQNLPKNTTITLIGRPNAGKSTLFNALLSEERSLVSNIPGTTRDKVEEKVQLGSREFNISDTAGIPRRKQKVQIDRYSSTVALKTLISADIALVVVDSELGLSFEDKRILKECILQNVTPLLVLNKWDMLDTESKNNLNTVIKNELKQYKWVTVIRISALRKSNIKQITKQIYNLEEQLKLRIGTSELNNFFRSLWLKNPPHPVKGRRAKLKYVTQFETFPPQFSFNLSTNIPENYLSFIENQLRLNFEIKNIAFNIKINA